MVEDQAGQPEFRTLLAPEPSPSAAEQRALMSDLRAAARGEVRFDEYTRVLYATDGSIYGAEPAGVVFPRDVDDVQAVVCTAADHGVPVLPRGAGSSLAGQAVGPGCVVLDCSRYLTDIVEIDPATRRARVQPGVVQDDLDAALAPYGLKFAPDPASSNRATIGGGIGNNSTGAHSVRYGLTDAYVDECEVVMADGSVIHTRDVVLDGEEWERIVSGDGREAALYRTVRALVEENADEIADRYPTLKRSVSGYNLQKVIRTTETGERVINLSTLLVGAEGTLGVVTEATLSLVTRPEETALLVSCYDDLIDAMRAVPAALACDVSAVELMDDTVFELAANSPEYADYADPIPNGTVAALMIEFDSECHDDLEGAVEFTREKLVVEGEATDAVTAVDSATQDRLWKLRKAAIPLLMALEGDPKPYPFVEDASVPPEKLAAYVMGVQEILADHGTEAAYFAHAGAGTLHIRPILSLKSSDGVETMRSIAGDVTDLALEHEGAFSGEHGDGLARTEFNPKLYGPELWAAFKALKTAFDPEWLLNPGKVVYRDDDMPGSDMREHLRYGSAYATLEPQTTLEFEREGGFGHLVELCNGCGTCRQRGTGVMCPTYRATDEEIATTRGRANLIRAAISGQIDPEAFYSDRFQSAVLDLCIGCKGCQNECPTGVDLAKLKAELTHQHHEREGVSLRERLFANLDRLAALGSATAPVPNRATELPGARPLLEHVLGIARDRTLPSFTRPSLDDRMSGRDRRVDPESATHRVILFPDTFTNYCNPELGEAAVALLEAADVAVRVPDLGPTGRAAYSQGLLEAATERKHTLCDRLEPALDAGWSVVFLEPSDASMVVDEYRSLSSHPADGRLAEAAFDICEFLDRRRLDERLAFESTDRQVAYHGHCHQTARGSDHHAVGVLRRAGYTVDPVDSGCCGMAGSFGFEAEHYDLSMAIGSLVDDALNVSGADLVVTAGASCRTQIADSYGGHDPVHPIEALADIRDR